MNQNNSNVGIEEVISNPHKYILPDAEEAALSLWAKNIFTSGYSDRTNSALRYLLINNLSQENQKIFHELIRRNPVNYYKERDTYGIRVRTSLGNVQGNLSKLTEAFEMQDVLEGYTRIEQFLMDQYGLKKQAPNPEYIKGLKAPDIDDYADKYGFMEAQRYYHYHSNQPEFIESFDESKRTKSDEEYVKEAGLSSLYDPERGVIYKSEFFKKAHERYLEYQKRRKSTPDLSRDEEK